MFVTSGIGLESITRLVAGHGPRRRPECTPLVLAVFVVDVWMRDDFKTQLVIVVLLEVESQVKPWQT